MLLLATVLSALVCNTAAIWRASIHSQVDHHSIVKTNHGMNYVSGNEVLCLKNVSDNENNNWLYPEDCTQMYVDATCLMLNCPLNGKHKIGMQQSCYGCTNDTITIRVDEVPRCYFWHVELENHNGMYNAKIRVDSIGRNDVHKSELITKLFHSRGEKPVFKTIAGNPYMSGLAQPVYNETWFGWITQIPASVVLAYPHLVIEPTLHTYIAGCMIAPVVYYIRPFDQSFLIKQVALVAKPGIEQRVHSHSCFPERNIFLIRDGAFFTNDDFLTNTQMFISQLHASQYSNVIDAAALSPDYLFIILRGTIFRAKLGERNLLFQKQLVNNVTEANFLGISTTPGCLFSISLKNIVSWENTFVAVWNESNIFITNILDPYWTAFALPPEYPGSSIVHVRLGIVPGDIAVLIQTQSTTNILLCTFLAGSGQLSNCSLLNLPFQSHAAESLSFEFLNAAFSSLLLWNQRSIGYIHNYGVEIGNFTNVQSIKSVSFSNDHGRYLIQDSDNRLFYGSGKCRKLLKLRKVDTTDSNIFHKFDFISEHVARIEWRFDDSLSIFREIFPLESEVYALMQATDNASVCDDLKLLSNFHVFKGNVKNLESMTDAIQVHFTVVYPSSCPVEVSFKSNFGNIVAMTEPVPSLSTRPHHSNATLKVQTIETNLSGSCSNTSCATGLVALEVEVLPADGSATCMLPLTQLLYINATCPVGLHIRIQNSSGDSCGSYSSDVVCIEAMTEEWMFDPIVDLYSFDERLYTIRDDILFREIYGKTGFELQDKNILKKDCYLCSQFRQSNWSHELYLQISESACPCQLEKYEPDKWIGKISFEEVMPVPGTSEDYVFEVTVLGNSFCQLSTQFTVRLITNPLVEFALWEYMVVTAFVAISILVFAYSYYEYMKFMREAKEKLS